MVAINVTELRQHLPDYLKQVQQGEEIAITLHGKTIARIVPENQETKQVAAIKRLAALRGKMIVGDVLESCTDEWTGDAEHLCYPYFVVLGGRSRTSFSSSH